MEMVDFNQLMKEYNVGSVEKVEDSGYFSSLAFQKLLDQEDIEIAARRAALFNQKDLLARRFNGIGNLLQNPISSNQDMDNFNLVYSELVGDLEEWKNRVVRLVEDNKRTLNHKY